MSEIAHYFVSDKGVICYCVLGTVNIHQLGLRKTGLPLIILFPVCSNQHCIRSNFVIVRYVMFLFL
jgi:hypothetical protein